MRCPVCLDVDLKIADRQGIEIDYCPQCRGVWLDRGELDKIIDRTNAQFAGQAPASQPPPMQAPPVQHPPLQHPPQTHAGGYGAPPPQQQHGQQPPRQRYRDDDDSDDDYQYDRDGRRKKRKESWWSELFDFD